MSASQFDPNVFLEAQVTEVNEKRPPLPEENPASPDGLYTAMIGEVKMNTGTIEKGERAGRPWLQAIVPLTVEVPPQLRDAMKLPPTVTLTDRPFIDLTDNNTIDMSPGRNRAQKAYREALDLNKPGDVFSWKMLQGKMLKVKIKHEMYEGAPVERIGALLKG